MIFFLDMNFLLVWYLWKFSHLCLMCVHIHTCNAMFHWSHDARSLGFQFAKISLLSFNASRGLCYNISLSEYYDHWKRAWQKKASRQKKDNMCKMQTCLEFDNCNHLLNSGTWVFVTLLMGQEGEWVM